MRYTKFALLLFGAGLLLGLVIIAFELDWLEWAASWSMALGIAAIPVGMAVDWRLATKGNRGPAPRGKGKPAAKGKPRPRRTTPVGRSPRKPAAQKGK
jgi:hypothetical protein